MHSRTVSRPRWELTTHVGQFSHGHRRAARVCRHYRRRRSAATVDEVDDVDVAPDLGKGPVPCWGEHHDAGRWWAARLGTRIGRVGSLSPGEYAARQELPLIRMRVGKATRRRRSANNEMLLHVGAVPAERYQALDGAVRVDPVRFIRSEMRHVPEAGW